MGRNRRLQRQLIAVWALALALATASRAEQTETDAEGEADSLAVVTDSGRLRRDLDAYRKRIALLEGQGGAFDAGLAEPLLGLGLTLQRAGDHAGAIEAFKRGVHLSRVNDGLYSERQVALLQGEIASHVALGNLDAADERQRYLYRVQVRALSDTPRGKALMQHARWQRQAYEAGLGEEPYERLLRMSSLYRLALSEIASSEGQNSPALLPPLYGMLRSQYLISGFVGERLDGSFRLGFPNNQEEQLQLAYGRSSFEQGAAVIRAIYDLRRAGPGATLHDSAEPTLMLGDWQWWHGHRDEALETYGALERELAGLEDDQGLRDAYFDNPQPLPSLAGVRALPDQAAATDGALLLEFGVNERGKVVDLRRLDENPVNDDVADDIMRHLRRVLFRPRFSDGMPVETAGMVVAYDRSHW